MAKKPMKSKNDNDADDKRATKAVKGMLKSMGRSDMPKVTIAAKKKGK